MSVCYLRSLPQSSWVSGRCGCEGLTPCEGLTWVLFPAVRAHPASLCPPGTAPPSTRGARRASQPRRVLSKSQRPLHHRTNGVPSQGRAPGSESILPAFSGSAGGRGDLDLRPLGESGKAPALPAPSPGPRGCGFIFSVGSSLELVSNAGGLRRTVHRAGSEICSPSPPPTHLDLHLIVRVHTHFRGFCENHLLSDLPCPQHLAAESYLASSEAVVSVKSWACSILITFQHKLS